MVDTEQTRYQVSYYNDLHHIAYAHAWEISQQAVDLLKQFSGDNDGYLFGTCRLHRHFVLAEGECVVTKLVNTEYVAEVARYDPSFVPW